MDKHIKGRPIKKILLVAAFAYSIMIAAIINPINIARTAIMNMLSLVIFFLVSNSMSSGFRINCDAL